MPYTKSIAMNTTEALRYNDIVTHEANRREQWLSKYGKSYLRETKNLAPQIAWSPAVDSVRIDLAQLTKKYKQEMSSDPYGKPTIRCGGPHDTHKRAQYRANFPTPPLATIAASSQGPAAAHMPRRHLVEKKNGYKIAETMSYPPHSGYPAPPPQSPPKSPPQRRQQRPLTARPDTGSRERCSRLKRELYAKLQRFEERLEQVEIPNGAAPPRQPPGSSSRPRSAHHIQAQTSRELHDLVGNLHLRNR